MATTTPTPAPPSGGSFLGLAIDVAEFFKTQFARAWFWARLVLVIQFGVTLLGMLGARFGNEDAGRFLVTLAGFAIAVLSNIVWGELAAAGLVLAAADPAVRAGVTKLSDLVGKPVKLDPLVDTAKVDFMLRWLFSVAAIMVAFDGAIVAFEMWNDFSSFLLFVTLALGLAYGAASWSATRVWLPRIQKGTLVFEGILITLILLNYLAPAQFGWAKVIYTRGSVIEKADNRENLRLIKSLGREYDRLAEERTDLVLRRVENADPEARINQIDTRQKEIRQQLATVGGDGPGTVISSWASNLSTAQGWGRARWSMALLISLLIGFGCFTLAKQKKIWPLVIAFLLILFAWPMARWMDGEVSASQTLRNAVGASPPTANQSTGVVIPVATPVAVAKPVATAKSESVLWPEAKATTATQTGNKWELGLDSRAMNETSIDAPDGGRVRVTITGTVRPEREASAVSADSGWLLRERVVNHPEQFPLPSGRFGQPLLLVGNTVYPLDGETNLTIAKGGNLSFLINDRGGLFADNTGTYKVTVELVK